MLLICGPFQLVQVVLFALTLIYHSPIEFLKVSEELLITTIISILYFNFIVIRDFIIIFFIAAIRNAVGPATVLFTTTLLFDAISFSFLSLIAYILLEGETEEFCPATSSTGCKVVVEFLASNMGTGFILMFVNIVCKFIIWIILNYFRAFFNPAELETFEEQRLQRLKSALASLRTDTFAKMVSSIDQSYIEKLTCCICLLEFQQDDRTTGLHCHEKHLFHEKCLIQALHAKLDCPICRTPIEAASR